jgi:hypothetical protein
VKGKRSGLGRFNSETGISEGIFDDVHLCFEQISGNFPSRKLRS